MMIGDQKASSRQTVTHASPGSMTIPAPVQSHIDRLAAHIAEIEQAVADEETQIKAFAEATELARDRISVLTPDLERLRLEHGTILFVVDKYESEEYWSKLYVPQIDPPAAAASAANGSPPAPYESVKDKILRELARTQTAASGAQIRHMIGDIVSLQHVGAALSTLKRKGLVLHIGREWMIAK